MGTGMTGDGAFVRAKRGRATWIQKEENVRLNYTKNVGVKTMIIDSHAHIFPYLGAGKEAGFSSAEEHLKYSQRLIHKHVAQPVRRKSDNSAVQKETLWDPTDSTEAGRYNVNFRVGKYGRYEWTMDGVDYYCQFMPPSLQDMTAPPELLKTMLDHAGVGKAVLQCGTIYGKLNLYYSKALEEFRDTFIPLASLEETEAYTDEGIQGLRESILSLGLRGLWFWATETSFSSRYDAFWSEAVSLGIPVFMFLFPVKPTFFALLRCLGEWKVKYPKLECVIPQAFPIDVIRKNNRFSIPRDIQDVISMDKILIELAYPISQGGKEDYPFPISQEAVHILYDTFGARKMVWGSDAPNVERFCTYAQSLNYLKKYCDFMSEQDKHMILGENLAELFGVKAEKQG